MNGVECRDCWWPKMQRINDGVASSLKTYTLFCPSLVSITVIKNNMGKEGSKWPTVPGRSEGKQEQKCKAGTGETSMEELCLLSSSCSSDQLPFLDNPGPLAYSELGSLTSINNCENTLQTYLHDNFIGTVLYLIFVLPTCVKLTLKTSHHIL